MNIVHRGFSDDDAALWLRLIGSDDSALDELMKRCFKELYHYGTKFSKDEDLIKDCIQDVFLDLWERRSSLRTE